MNKKMSSTELAIRSIITGAGVALEFAFCIYLQGWMAILGLALVCIGIDAFDARKDEQQITEEAGNEK